MHDAITESCIERATTLFWEQMLAMPMQLSATEAPLQTQDQGPLFSRCIGENHVFGECRLTGAWQGRIEIRMSMGLAIAATAGMLMQPAELVGDSDLLDAAKEIANMTAGTIKSALPRPCTMTVPIAEIVPADFCALPETLNSIATFFEHANGELVVFVYEDSAADSFAVGCPELLESIYQIQGTAPVFAGV
jgi:CheY-specific phosphatase CheX